MNNRDDGRSDSPLSSCNMLPTYCRMMICYLRHVVPGFVEAKVKTSQRSNSGLAHARWQRNVQSGCAGDPARILCNVLHPRVWKLQVARSAGRNASSELPQLSTLALGLPWGAGQWQYKSAPVCATYNSRQCKICQMGLTSTARSEFDSQPRITWIPKLFPLPPTESG